MGRMACAFQATLWVSSDTSYSWPSLLLEAIDTIYRNHIHAGEVPRRIHEQPKSMNPAANKTNTQDAGQIFQSPSTSTQSSATPVPLQVPQGAVAPANGGPLFGAQSPSKSNGNPYQYVATRPPHDDRIGELYLILGRPG